MKLNTFLLGIISLVSISAFAGEAMYTVPVKAKHLKKLSKFKLENVEQIEKDGVIEVRYVLPQELTGTSDVLSFTGVIDPNKNSHVLESENGTMTCIENQKTVCKIKFKNLRIDEVVRNQVLESLSSSPAELAGRRAVAASFSNDPGGVLTYTYSEKPDYSVR